MSGVSPTRPGNIESIPPVEAPAATVRDLAQGTLNLFGATNPIQTIGIRDGEKMHEMLVTSEELVRSDDFGDYYRISCSQRRDYNDFYSRGVISARIAQEGYTSENAPQLSVADVEQLIANEQPQQLAVGDVEHRLAGLGVAERVLGVRQQP